MAGNLRIEYDSKFFGGYDKMGKTKLEKQDFAQKQARNVCKEVKK